MKSKEDIRRNIDNIDQQVLKLLRSRMEMAVLIRRFKDNTLDNDRELIVKDCIKQGSKGLLAEDLTLKLYEDIIAESRRLQDQDLSTIAFAGEHGAFAEQAAMAWGPGFTPLPVKEFSDVFDAIETGAFDCGVVPVENTLGGNVSQVNRLLISTKLSIIGAVDLPINHCLLMPEGADYREIRKVYSHPQGLAQCREFLMRNKLEPVEFYNTAGAAKMVAESGTENIAAIASELAADIYGLNTVKKGIQDMDNNRTRFVILSRKAVKEGGSKCSAVFSTAHKAGTLFHVLEKFASAGMNLTRIESVPDKPGHFAFFIDFTGFKTRDDVENVLNSLKENLEYINILGYYDEIVL